MSQKIECSVCKALFSKKNYLYHIENEHPEHYERLINNIVKNNNERYSVKEIAAKYNVTEKFVETKIEEIREQRGEYNIKKPLKIKLWEPRDFNMEATTIWSFPDRGNWATHKGNYRGNWSPYIPRNIIQRYSKEGDVVLDQFVGSGTTLVETKLLKRKGIGIDINPSALDLARVNTDFQRKGSGRVIIRQGDARNLGFINSESIDLICTHPPYSNIIKYSKDIQGDLSHYDIDEFIIEMQKVASESIRVLKKGKFCAILIGDTRRNRNIIPLGFKVMQVFVNAGFTLKEIIIKEQHNCKATGFWYTRSIEYNFLLIAHEYLFVFIKF
jgi:methylase of polypeptide subunit release factors